MKKVVVGGGGELVFDLPSRRLALPDLGHDDAAADLHESRMERSLKGITKRYEKQVNVTADRKFLGFDAYRKAIDLSPAEPLAGLAIFEKTQNHPCHRLRVIRDEIREAVDISPAGTVLRELTGESAKQAGGALGRHVAAQRFFQAAQHHVGQHLPDGMPRRNGCRPGRVQDAALRRRDPHGAQ